MVVEEEEDDDDDDDEADARTEVMDGDGGGLAA